VFKKPLKGFISLKTFKQCFRKSFDNTCFSFTSGFSLIMVDLVLHRQVAGSNLHNSIEE